MTGYEKSPDYGSPPREPVPKLRLLLIVAYVALMVYLLWFRN
jgi:hypothetical protein